MKTKKLLTMFLAGTMMVGMLAGCGNGDADKKPDGNGGDGDKVYTIGILQQLEHPALDEATRGFKEGAIAKFGEANVKFDVKNGQNEQANCATIANSFVSSNVDLILANATTALQSSAAATNTIPILGTSITDYATALDIKDWSGATGTNISGTSDLAPINEQEAVLKELFPDVKKVGIVYCSGEPNSKYQADLFKLALDQDGIAYAEFTAADSNEIQSVVTAAIADCDVLYIPTDNTMADATEIINNICEPAKVPIIAGEENICRGCGVATLSISYYDIGYKAGEMAYDVLVNGADIATMNIEYAPQVTKKYNAKLCDSLGITIPEGYEPIADAE